MNALARALVTLLAAAAAGALLWVAAQFNSNATGGYWAALGVVAAGGLLLGLTQLRSSDGYPLAQLLVVLVPVAITALWVIAVAEPSSNAFRSQLRSWDSDLGISGAVQAIGRWNGAIALGLGLVLGIVAAPGLVRRRRAVVVPAASSATVVETEPLPESVPEDRPPNVEPQALPPTVHVGPTASQH